MSLGGEEDTDLHTSVYSASDSDAPQSSQVVGLPVVLTKLSSYTALDLESQQLGYGSSWVAQKLFLLDERWLELSPNVSDDSPKISPNLYRFLRKTPTLSENAS